MRRLAPVIAVTIYQLAWAAWLGGLITLGAVSAPGIFRAAKGWPEAATAGTVYRFAGIAAGEGFRRFNTVALVCGVLLLLAAAGWWAVDRRRPALQAWRAVLGVLCLCATCWLAFRVYPEMVALQEAGQMAGFDALHHLYEDISKAQVWLLLGIGVLTAVLLVPPGDGARAAGSAPPHPDLGGSGVILPRPPSSRGDAGALCVSEETLREAREEAGIGSRDVGNLVVGGKLITEEHLREARDEQRRSGGEIGEILVQWNLITPIQLLQARAHLHGIKPVDLASGTVNVDASAVSAMPANVARRHHCLPIMKQGDTLVVATADPTNPLAAEDLRVATGLRIRFVLADRASLDQAIQRHYS